MKSKWMTLLVSLALVAGLFGVLPVFAGPEAPLVAISLTGGAYTQDFNSLANTGTSSTVPTGWAFLETDTNANTTYAAGTGSDAAGNTYSFGASSATDRAFGGLRSGSLVPTIGAEFQNNTGNTIISLAISYDCEQWRSGVANRGAADQMDFQYSTSATSLNTGTWTDVDGLDCLTTAISVAVGAKDGNDAAYRTSVSNVITGLNIGNSATFWLRWTDFDISNSDDGLGVDDFSLTPTNPSAVTLADFYAVQQGDGVLLTWETNSELNNRGFNLYRGVSPDGWDRRLNEHLIPSQSQGSPGGFVYTWEDEVDLVPGTTYYYWVSDVDLSGAETMHGPVSVDFVVPTAVTLGDVSASSGLATAAYSTYGIALLLALLAPLAGAAWAARRRAWPSRAPRAALNHPAPGWPAPSGGFTVYDALNQTGPVAG